MSRFFARSGETGEYGDVVWRRQKGVDWQLYHVYVGDKRIGQVSCGRMAGHWTAVSNTAPEHRRGLGLVDGFATRWTATEYLLNVGFRYGPADPMTLEDVKFRMESEQRVRERIEHTRKEP